MDPGASSWTNGQLLSTTMSFNLQEAQSCSEIPACRGPEVLAILVKIDPISGKESEEYPHIFPKDYPERVEKFCGNYIWRKITGDITAEFLEALVDRMFTADEVTRYAVYGGRAGNYSYSLDLLSIQFCMPGRLRIRYDLQKQSAGFIHR
jgi:hypothetical protein